MPSTKLLEVKKEVIELPHEVPDNPMVSVCVPTYQHADYIRSCLDSILMQECGFPFEIILGEDESTDGTREICLEYAKDHADKIRLFLHSRENNIIIDGHPTGRFNVLYSLSQARGKYVALCEGDDYWTDPHKLQKQVDFLEANVDFAICHHNMNVVYEDGNKASHLSNSPDQREISSIDDLARGNFIFTASCVFRNNLAGELPDWYSESPVGDYLLHLLNAQYGRIRYMPDVMGSYRIHRGGMWESTPRASRLERWMQVIDLIMKYFPPEIKRTVVSDQEIEISTQLMDHFSHDPRKHNFYFRKLMEGITYLSRPSNDIEAHVLPPKVSIVVRLAGNTELSRKCLLSIYANTPHDIFELILIYDAETDGQDALVRTFKSQYGNVISLRNDRRLSFATSANQGINLSDSGYVVFLGDNTEVTSGWLETLLQEAGTDNVPGIVGGTLLQAEGMAGVNPEEDGRDVEVHSLRSDSADKPEDAASQSLVSGLCMLVSREVIRRIGGFNERLTERDPDRDFSDRAAGAGFRIRISDARANVNDTQSEEENTDLAGNNSCNGVQGHGNEEEPQIQQVTKTAEDTFENIEDNEGNVDLVSAKDLSVADVGKTLAEAESSIGSGDYRRADIALKRVLASFPYNVDALNDLAVARIMAGKKREAAALLERVLSIDPDNKTASENRSALNKEATQGLSGDRKNAERKGDSSRLEEDVLEYRRSVERIASMENFNLPGEVPWPILENAFRNFGDWHTRFTFNGRRYGGTNSYTNDPRIIDFLTWFPNGGKVLELGSFEGSHTIRLVQSPRIEFVMGLEGKDYLIQRSKLIKAISGGKKMDFAKCDFETDDISVFGRFDAVFCAGLLYLLSKPWEIIDKIASVSDSLFISTHYARTARSSSNGFDGEYHENEPYEAPLSGLSQRSFWLTFDSLVKALQQNDFEVVNVRHYNDWGGIPLVNMSCRKKNSCRGSKYSEVSLKTSGQDKPTMQVPAHGPAIAPVREQGSQICVPTMSGRTRRRSCPYIEHGLILHQNHLQMCCSYHHDRGAIQIGPYTGGPFPMEMVLHKREEVKEANRTGVYYGCDGCSFLQERDWLDVPPYLIGVMDISVSSACQLRCQYCYTVKTPEIAGRSSYDLYETCSEFVRNGWLSPNANIVWTGGEPTAFKRFDETLSLLMQGNIRHRIFTNGYRYSETVARGAMEGHVQLICSLDAGTAETYEKVKGKNYFERVKETCSKYAESAGDFRLKYLCVKDNARKTDADGFMNLVQQWGIKNIFLDADLTEPKANQDVIDTLGYMYARAGQNGVVPDFYDGVKGFPELKLPERIMEVAARIRLDDLHDCGNILLSIKSDEAKGLAPLNSVQVMSGRDGINLISAGDDPSVLLPEFWLPRNHRAVVSIDITSPCEDMLQVFYIPDAEFQYTEFYSIKVTLTAGRNKVILSGFPNSGGIKGRVRLDPGIHQGVYTLHSLTVSAEETGSADRYSRKGIDHQAPQCNVNVDDNAACTIYRTVDDPIAKPENTFGIQNN